VLTQYKAHSLILHIQKGWGFLRGEFGEFVELWPAQQRVTETAWYAGTADAVFQNLDIIRNHDPEYVLILAGDHIYKMDYGTMIARHVESGADMTVGCIEVDLERAREVSASWPWMRTGACAALSRSPPIRPPSRGATDAPWHRWASTSSIATSSSSSSSRMPTPPAPVTTSARTSSPASSAATG
jgi:hypothetical protein